LTQSEEPGTLAGSRWTVTVVDLLQTVMRRRAVILGTVLLCAVHPALGAHDGVPSPQERPVFRISTRLVQISVIVTDKNRQSVPGLTAADFRVFDNGQEQRLDLFSAESDPVTRTPAAVVAAGHEPVREFSNRLEGRVGGGVTAILFDRLNTRAEDQFYARGQVVKFLEQIRPEDRIGLYVLDGDMVRVLHDFTSDASSLVRATSRFRGVTSTELAVAEEAPPDLLETGDARLDAEMAAFLEASHQRMVEHFTGVRGDATITALESVANHLAGVRGRKNLIWVSSGFPLSAFTSRGKSRTVEINRATRALNSANVAIYTVDARGLVSAFASPPGARKPVFTSLATVSPNLDILQIVAEETGGRAFLNTNDIKGAVRRAVEDARVTYVLGYYPSHSTWDSKYHEIRVKVARSGVQVRHRKGYLALAKQKQDDPERSASLLGTIRSPLEANGLGLAARVEGVEGSRSDVQITIRLDPGSVVLERAADHWEGSLDVVIAQVHPDGTVVRSYDRTVSLTISAERLDQMIREGFTMRSNVAVLPDVQRLHLVVRDISTGSLGSIIVPGEKLRAILEGETRK